MAEQIAVVMTGDAARLDKAFQKQFANQETMERGFKKVKKSAEDTTQAVEKTAHSLRGAAAEGDEAFGATMQARVRDYIAGFGTATVIIGAVQQAIAKMRQDTAAAVQEIDRLQEQRREMAQLATDSADYQVLKGGAQRISTRFGLDQNEAFALTNAARAGGFESNIDQVALAAATFAPADDLTATAAVLPTIFEGLTPEQALNLTAAGGTAAKAMAFRGIAEQLRVGAQGGKQAGASAVETAALVTIMSDLFGMSTGDRVRAFGSKVGQSDMAGIGIMGAFDRLRGMDDAGRKAFLGESQELHAVYKFLSERGDDVRAMEKTLAAGMNASGTDQSPLMIGARSFLEDSENRGVFQRNVARQQRVLAEQQELGVPGLAVEEAKEDVRRHLSSKRADWVTRVFTEAAMATTDVVTDDPRYMRAMGAAASGGPLQLNNLLTGNSVSADAEWARRSQAASDQMVENILSATASLDRAAKNLETGSSNVTGAARREATMNRE